MTWLCFEFRLNECIQLNVHFWDLVLLLLMVVTPNIHHSGEQRVSSNIEQITSFGTDSNLHDFNPSVVDNLFWSPMKKCGFLSTFLFCKTPPPTLSWFWVSDWHTYKISKKFLNLLSLDNCTWNTGHNMMSYSIYLFRCTSKLEFIV